MMPRSHAILICLSLAALAASGEQDMHSGKSWDFDPVQHRLEHADGTPFLWLAGLAPVERWIVDA
jgi:hypothetical protein